MTPANSIEKRYCKRCNATKDADLFYEDRKYCMRCLDKEKEKYWKHIERKEAYDKAYGQVEEYCAVCECNVKKKRFARHQKTQKHQDNSEKSWKIKLNNKFQDNFE